MKHLQSLSLLFSGILLLTSCNNRENNDTGKQLGSLYISKSKPERGDQLQLSYKSSDTISSEKTEGYVYYIVNENIYPQDLELRDSADVYLATVKVPDSVTALAFNFRTNDRNDTNDKKGYAVNIYDADGNPVAGSESSLAYFYEYPGSSLGIQVKKDSLLAAYKSDITAHPELKNGFWGSRYAQALYANDKEAAQKFTDAQIAEISKKDTLSEEDYIQLNSLYSSVQEKAKSDSVKNIIANKFPKSRISQQGTYMFFRQKNDLEQKEKIFNEYQQSVGENGMYKDAMLADLANSYLSEGKLDKFYSYTDKISDKSAKASAYNNAAWSLYQENKNLDEAANISKKSVDLIAEEKEDPNKPDYQTKSQYEKSLDYSSRAYMDTYAAILFKQGKKEEALNYQEKAITGNEDVDPEMNERYLQYLIANNDYKKAQEQAENFIVHNEATEKSKEYLRDAYVKNKGSESNYQDYLKELEEKAHNNALAELKKEMISEEAPKFNLVDLKGNKVSLESLKGKTVVVDFWATWCGPCKRSFPGMQMAVEKYKDSSNVQFLFVDTWERQAPDAREKEVKDFIANHNYDFHVLLDQPKQAGSNDFATVSEYGVSGIPTKFIIGPEGKIRFKKVGFDGNTQKLADEVEMMINLAQSKP